MHELTERLLRTVQKADLLRPGDRVAVAVSGGADSVALLFLLVGLREELGIVLSVAHVNHKLRGEESEEDERFVARLAQQHGLEFHLTAAPIDGCESPRKRLDGSISAGSGIEANARKLRYDFFRELVRGLCVTKIATAHTLDDQAETILLRIFRGTGIRGLAGIHPRIAFEDQGRVFGEVVRPLLPFRRSALRDFLRERGQDWREDTSNRNIAFLRNRVRHRLLPLIIEDIGESAIEHMGELAEIARAEEDHWTKNHLASTRHGIAADSDFEKNRPQPSPLPLELLLALDLAAQRRSLRAWLEANAPDVSVSFRLIEEALELARISRSHQKSLRQKLELTRGWNLRLVRQGRNGEFQLALETSECHKGKAEESRGRDYQYVLHVPGAIDVPELLTHIEAQVIDVRSIPPAERAQLLDAARLPKRVLIRNWRARDRYWPAHTAAARKVKELLSDRHASGIEKKLWPVAVAEGHGLLWMRGFAVPAALQPADDAITAIWIRESRA